MEKKKKGITPMDAALSYLAAKARTVREMELHLDSKGFGEAEVDGCVERLRELGYLNDERYAADFVESRLNTKPVSRRKLREQLYNHKLPQAVIDQALSAVTDEIERDNAAAVAAKFWRQFEGLEEFDRKTRVMRRLAGRGYDFGLVRERVEAVVGSLEQIGPETLEEEDTDA